MKIALNLRDLTDAETLSFTSTIITALTGNVTFTPSPALDILAGMRTNAQNAIDAVAAAKQALSQAVQNKDAAMNTLRGALTDEANTVEATVDVLTPDTQEAAILSAGMQPQSAPTRLTSLDAPADLAISAGDEPGTLDWHCDPVDRAKFYVVETTTDPLGAAAKWTPTPSGGTSSRGTITGLTSGTAVGVRVHAAGTRGIVGPATVAGPKIVP